MGEGFIFLFFHGQTLTQTYAWMAVSTLAFVYTPPTVLRFLLVLPEEAAARSVAASQWVWLFSVLGITYPSWLFGFPFPHPVGTIAHFGLGGIGLFVTLGLILRGYLRSGPAGRRKLKWLFLGGYLSIAPFAVASILTAIAPDFWGSASEVALILLVLIPICVFAAILDSHLFDIDRILTATASYSILIVLFVAVMMALGPLLAEGASDTMGIDPTLSQIALTLLLASAAVPAYLRLRPFIERLVFPERHALGQGMDLLLQELSACNTPDEVLRLAGERLHALLRPDVCAVYARRLDCFEPLFVAGLPDARSIEADSPLIAAVRQRVIPLIHAKWSERTSSRTLDAFEKAALDNLGLAAVLPVRHRGALGGLIFLGPKRSRDIYTNADLALFSVLVERVGNLWEGTTEPAQQVQTVFKAPFSSTSRSVAGNEIADSVERAVRSALPAVVVIELQDTNGTGFFVTPNGYLLTTHHVVEDTDKVSIRTGDGRCLEATVEARAPERDLALLKAEYDVTPPLVLGSSEVLAMGAPVIAIGSPGSAFGTLHQTVTKGIVSGLRTLPSPTDRTLSLRFIQTDAALNRGSSGGPLLTPHGAVIGICSLKDHDPMREGLSFAIAIDEALEAFPALRQWGTLVHQSE
jgi:S1-C subfamily serine protease